MPPLAAARSRRPLASHNSSFSDERQAAARKGGGFFRPLDITKPRICEHEPWPQEVLDAVMNAGSPTTRLAIETGLYSGQRISDCIRFTHKMLATDTIDLDQAKRRSKGARLVEVYIPVHPNWREAVARVPKRADTILYDRSGLPFKDTDALQERIRDLMKAEVFVDKRGLALYTFHGLRKNAANYLAEIGCDEAQIGAICGMNSATVRLYTKRARKRIIAESARDVVFAGDVARQATGLHEGKNGVTTRKLKAETTQ